MKDLSNKIVAIKAGIATRVMKIIRAAKRSKTGNAYKTYKKNKSKKYNGKRHKTTRKSRALIAIAFNFKKLDKVLTKITKAIKTKKQYQIVATLCLVLCIAVIIALASVKSTVYAVKLNGEAIGYVKSANQINQMIHSVENKMSQKYGTKVIFCDDKVAFTPIKVNKIISLDENKVRKNISKPEYYFTKAWIITSNGKEAVACAKKQDAEKLLERLKAYYKRQGVEYTNAYFKEKAEIKEVTTAVSKLPDKEEAFTLLLTGTKEQKQHTVADGETLWSISNKYGMTVDQLLEANPEANPDKLKANQVLNLYIVKPYFTVVTVEKATQKEPIQFGIKYEKTNALYQGEEKIKTKGTYGTKEIKKELIEENGIEIASNLVSEKVVAEPQSQIVLKGTKGLSAYLGTGDIGNPTRGSLSSFFGGRWGKQHQGIDIRGKMGTSIYAVDSGVIVFSGRDGAYGNKIIIDHGKGLTTVYAHCSQLYVDKGQKVDTGEKIASMGDTGNATGVHLHFEVRKNGVPQNPLEYVHY